MKEFLLRHHNELAVVALLYLFASAAVMDWAGKRLVRGIRDKHLREREQFGSPEFRLASSLGGIREMNRIVLEPLSAEDLTVRSWRRRARFALLAYYSAALVFLAYWLSMFVVWPE